MQYAGIIILLIACSLVSTMCYAYLKNRVAAEEHRIPIFYIFSFFFAVNIFLLSAVKYYLGYHKESLFESFWNVQAVTFMHYGIPLVVIGVLLSAFMCYAFRKTGNELIRFFDSVMFLGLSFAWLLVRKMKNGTYCIVFFIALVATVSVILVWKKKNIIYIYDKKKYFIDIIPFILYWFIIIVMTIPNELYLSNSADFPISYGYFFGKLFLGGIVSLIILCAGIILFLSKKQSDILGISLFILLTVGYIQRMFLNGLMGNLDGTQKTWSASQRVINLAIWGAIVGIAVIFFFWKKEITVKIMKVISGWIILTQLVSLAILISTSGNTASKSESALTTEGMLEVGANNIIVFVLDKFDGRRMDEILLEDSTFLTPLKDFTYYKNATSEFCPTGYSIPYLLTGTEFKGPDEWYLSYAYNENMLLNDLKKQGYEVGVYTNTAFVPEENKKVISNYKEGVKRTCNTWELLKLMTQCSKYSMAPFVVKNYYQYDTSDIALLVTDDNICNIENDLPFYRNLKQDGLSVNEGKSIYRFIHMHGAHPPYIMTEDFQYLSYDARRDEHYGSSGVSQAKGALKIVYEYIRQLQELGKYDAATIIITADHGETKAFNDGNGNMTEISFPILLVKEANSTKNEVKISTAPVSHADLMPTIRMAAGMDVGERTVADFSENEERIRYMKVGYGGELFESYEIKGNVRNIGNWKVLSSEKVQAQNPSLKRE